MKRDNLVYVVIREGYIECNLFILIEIEFEFEYGMIFFFFFFLQDRNSTRVCV